MGRLGLKIGRVASGLVLSGVTAIGVAECRLADWRHRSEHAFLPPPDLAVIEELAQVSTPPTPEQREECLRVMDRLEKHRVGQLVGSISFWSELEICGASACFAGVVVWLCACPATAARARAEQPAKTLSVPGIATNRSIPRQFTWGTQTS